MLKSVGVILFSFLPLISLSATQQYRLDAQIYADGHLISSPRFISNAGQKAEAGQRESGSADRTVFGITATDSPDPSADDSILMKVNIEYVKGDKTIKASTHVIAAPGKQQIIPIGDDQVIEVKLTATRL